MHKFYFASYFGGRYWRNVWVRKTFMLLFIEYNLQDFRISSRTILNIWMKLLLTRRHYFAPGCTEMVHQTALWVIRLHFSDSDCIGHITFCTLNIALLPQITVERPWIEIRTRDGRSRSRDWKVGSHCNASKCTVAHQAALWYTRRHPGESDCTFYNPA